MIQTWPLPSREIWLMWLFETMYSLCVCFTYICMRIAFIRDPVSPGLLSHQRCLHSLAKGPKFKTICMHTLCYGMLCQIYMQCIAIPTPSSHTYAWRTRGRRALSIKNCPISWACLVFVFLFVRLFVFFCCPRAPIVQSSEPGQCFLFVFMVAQVQQLSNLLSLASVSLDSLWQPRNINVQEKTT